jgi:ketopantoate hydroxymethyltransferase
LSHLGDTSEVELTRGQAQRGSEDESRNQTIRDVWDLHEAGKVHLVYLVVDTESISFEKKQPEIKDGSCDRWNREECYSGLEEPT